MLVLHSKFTKERSQKSQKCSQNSTFKFPLWYPRRTPWFGNIRHGPCFKNFVMPMLTESKDERNVIPNNVCLPDFRHTSNIQILSSNKSSIRSDSFSIIKSNAIMNKITNCGNASTRVSENVIEIAQ